MGTVTGAAAHTAVISFAARVAVNAAAARAAAAEFDVNATIFAAARTAVNGTVILNEGSAMKKGLRFYR